MNTDVIIIGGGPAGSTCASLLAREGLSTLVLEKETFPRFHIGESLLPCDLPIFERLGFSPERTDYIFKSGAEFINERTGDHAEFSFSSGLQGTRGHAWQVERARFDEALLNRSIALGAKVHFSEKVTDLSFAPERVSVTTDKAQYTARYLIDATGQDALLARRQKTVEPIKGFGRGAIFCHFEGLGENATRELTERGNIKILMLEDGWAWAIPLIGKLSVGLVSKAAHLQPEQLEAMVKTSPLLSRLTQGASQTAPKIIRNFSFINRRAHGPRWVCVGDAACFLDPVFSSGVSLAMLGSERVADILILAFSEGTEADPKLMEDFKAQMQEGYDCFGTLIKSFYDTKFAEHLFFYDSPDETMRAGLVSILAGDVWRADNVFQKALMGGRRRWRSYQAE